MRLKIMLMVLLLIFICSGCSSVKNENKYEKYSEESKDLEQPLFWAEKDDSFCLYGEEGTIVKEYQNYIGYFNGNGLAPAENLEGKMGFVNEQGEFVIEPIFSEVMPFAENGLAAVAIEKGNNSEILWGYIDERGNEIIECEYQTATSFYDNGYAKVGKKREEHDSQLYDEYVIDSKGKFVIKCENEDFSMIEMNKNYVVVTTFDGSVIYDYNGNVIEKAKADETFAADYNNVYKNVITKIGYSYDDVTTYLYKKGDFIKMSYNDYEIETYNGVEESVSIYVEKFDMKFVAEKCSVATTSSGYAWKIKFDNKIVLPMDYDSFESLSDNYLALYKYENITGDIKTADLYDIKNKKIVATDIAYNLVNTEFNMPDGYFLISNLLENESGGTDCGYGVIDYTGKIIIEPVCLQIIPYTFEAMSQKIDFDL